MDFKKQADSLKDKFGGAKDKTEEYIEKHPLKSALIAFGVGIVAGALLLKLLEKK